MRVWVAGLVSALYVAGIPTSLADVGGQVPGPGLCQYPGVGTSHQIMDEYEYTCDFPTEINGSHWHCEWGGYVLSASANAGVNVLIFNAGVGIQGYIGGVAGSCTWRCPDLSLADQPNPPGAWARRIIPAHCVSVAPAPTPLALPPAQDDSP